LNVEKKTTKFFLTALQAEVGNMTIPGELGICLPAACSDEDLIVSADWIFKKMTGHHDVGFFVPRYKLPQLVPGSKDPLLPKQPPHTVSHLNPTNVDDDLKPWNTGATVTCCVVLALATWTALSTAVVLMVGHDSQGQSEAGQHTSQALSSTQTPGGDSFHAQALMPFIEAWSLVGPKGTWTLLWNCPSRRPTDCLNGIRVISMFFIVLAHSFMVSGTNAGYSNAEDIKKSPLTPDAAETTWQIQFLIGAGDMSVDTFFFISGFLLSFIAKSRYAPVFMGTVLRYFRIVPSMAFMLLIFGWLSPRTQTSGIRSRVLGL